MSINHRSANTPGRAWVVKKKEKRKKKGEKGNDEVVVVVGSVMRGRERCELLADGSGLLLFFLSFFLSFLIFF